MKNELELPAKLSEAVQNSKINDLPEAQNIAANYAPFLNEVTEIANKVHKLSIDDPRDLEIAKRARLDLGKIASRASEQKKDDKDIVLVKGRFIDSLFNVVNGAARLTQEEAKNIENHHENIERKRLDDSQFERVNLLSEYVEDAHERDLSGMDQDVWEAYLSTKKQTHADIIAAEIKAEQDRQDVIKAVQAEQERIRIENQELKKAAELKAEQAEIERLKREEVAKIEQDKRDKIELERLAKENKERVEREEIARLEKEKQQAIIDAEKEKAYKLAKELSDKKAEDERIELERLANQQAELNKGDAAKVKDLIHDLKSLKSKYQFKSIKNQKMYQDINVLIDKVTSFIESK